MRRPCALGLFLLLGFTAARAGSLEDQLRADYEGKVLILRTFYDGKELHFDSGGKKLQGGEPGPWTLDAEVQVKKLRLSKDKLEVEGKRLFLVYDQKANQFEDVLTWIDANQEGDRKKDSRDSVQAQQPVRIVLELPPGDRTDESLRAALQKVFLTPEEHLADFVPPYWGNVVRALYGGSPPPAKVGGEGLFRVGGGVSAPHATYMPDPEYSEAARAARFQGSPVLELVIGVDGEVRDVRIVKPVGLGLDDKTVEIVQRWKFQPALKDGHPVAVAVRVETTFHLY